ncbi:EAL domain-containing protein [Salmonella enterica subsp. enterica serovar Weltevreden]|nr:EAL domain-containing protein [Salmonella enterica subsp. enterica serovar Weltevreden]
MLELAERDALLDVDYRLMRELHRKGVKLAIDDFGTGNSSLWLEKLRPDILKSINPSPPPSVPDAVNSTVTDIIIARWGKRLNIELWWRKGSKTRRRHSICASASVQMLQGYLYAAGSISEFPQWLAGSAPPPARA